MQPDLNLAACLHHADSTRQEIVPVFFQRSRGIYPKEHLIPPKFIVMMMMTMMMMKVIHNNNNDNNNNDNNNNYNSNNKQD